MERGETFSWVKSEEQYHRMGKYRRLREVVKVRKDYFKNKIQKYYSPF